jgi:hypothetical protein
MSSLVDLKYNIYPKGPLTAAQIVTALSSFAVTPYPIDLFNKVGLVLNTIATSGTNPVVLDLQFFLHPNPNGAMTAAITQGGSIDALTGLTIGTKGHPWAEPPIISFLPGLTPPARAAQARATLDVLAANIVLPGTGYTAPVVTAVGGLGPGGVAATFSATEAAGAINNVTVLTNGSGYISQPFLVVTDPTGKGALVTPFMELNAVSVVDGGGGYVVAPTVVLTAGFQYRFPNNPAAPFVNMLTNLLKATLGAPVTAQIPSYTP